ncbi:hypothetical protein OAG11_06430 [Verrucomicrobia bacterium]|nr:hypothetical protein [Verrucomicrobiota bacterium]
MAFTIHQASFMVYTQSPCLAGVSPKNLQVEIKGIRVSGPTCKEIWGNQQYTPMPDLHLSQKLSEKGAQIIFIPTNGGRRSEEEVHWVYYCINMWMRAAVGRLWDVDTDYPFPMHYHVQ